MLFRLIPLPSQSSLDNLGINSSWHGLLCVLKAKLDYDGDMIN